MRPDKFDGNLITKTFYSDWDPEGINCGECFCWAYYARHIFHQVEMELWSTINHHHAFIKIGSRFYDSERPRGSRDWRLLPCNKFAKIEVAWAHPSLEDFQSYWGQVYGGKVRLARCD